MKAVLLAGGSGTRLRPLTHAGPKQLCPVANVPVLERAVDRISAAGIDEVGVVLGNNGRDSIRELLGDGSDYGVEVSYVVQGDPGGLAEAVGCARSFVGDSPFLVHFGDVLFGDGFSGFVAAFEDSDAEIGLGVHRVAEPRHHAIVYEADGRPVEVVEKPDDPAGDRSPVLDIFDPVIFEYIDRVSPSARDELEIVDAIQLALDDGVSAFTHDLDGWFVDVGTRDGLLRGNRLVLEETDHAIEGEVAPGADVSGPVTVADGAVIESGVTVEGPVAVGAGTEVRGNAHLGPHVSLGVDCTVTGARIESSVVRSGARISVERKLARSVVGRRATITEGDAVELFVGRDANVSFP